MIKTSITLQELRRKIYVKAKADKSHRFWGLYVHVCKHSTLEEAYRMVKRNNGAPGIDGMTFDDIEQKGVESFLQVIQQELIDGSYQPTRNRLLSLSSCCIQTTTPWCRTWHRLWRAWISDWPRAASS